MSRIHEDPSATEIGRGARKAGFGDIVVSTVVTSEEGSMEDRTPGGNDTRSERSDSLRSLVRRKEDPDDFDRQQKSWLA